MLRTLGFALAMVLVLESSGSAQVEPSQPAEVPGPCNTDETWLTFSCSFIESFKIDESNESRTIGKNFEWCSNSHATGTLEFQSKLEEGLNAKVHFNGANSISALSITSGNNELRTLSSRTLKHLAEILEDSYNLQLRKSLPTGGTYEALLVCKGYKGEPQVRSTP